MIRLLLIALALSLSGCGSTVRQQATTDTVQHEVLILTANIPFPCPQIDGTIKIVDLPISARIVKDGSILTKREASSETILQGPELGTVIAAAIKQAFPIAGAFMGQPVPSDPTTKIITAITALTAAAGVAGKIRSDAQRLKDAKADAEFHKADAAEGWAKATAT